ncbi:MAG: alanine racemase, partial [Spirochaetaceae bacterium]|nr:alanine racemase [Spirochaetaceae bacterium]
MAYIYIDTKKIAHNLSRVLEVCTSKSVELSVVVKFALSEAGLVRFLAHNGVSAIADSNMAAFAKELPAVKKGLIKTRLSDILALPHTPPAFRPDVLYISDEALLTAALSLPDVPDIFLIAEAGDYRDGFAPEEIPAVAARYAGLPFAGVAANFGCLSGCMPSVETVRRLKEASCAAAEAAAHAQKAASNARKLCGGMPPSLPSGTSGGNSGQPQPPPPPGVRKRPPHGGGPPPPP